jgi:hypothetical protein
VTTDGQVRWVPNWVTHYPGLSGTEELFWALQF